MMFWVAPWIRLYTVLISRRAAELSQRRKAVSRWRKRAAVDATGTAVWSSGGARTAGEESWTG